MLSVWRYLKCRYQSIEFSRRDTPWKTNQWQWKDNQCNEDMKITISYWELGDVPWSSSELWRWGRWKKWGFQEGTYGPGPEVWHSSPNRFGIWAAGATYLIRHFSVRTKNSSINALKKRQGGIIGVAAKHANGPKISKHSETFFQTIRNCQH